MISRRIRHAEHMPAVGTEERLPGDGPGCLRPGVDVLQSRHLQLEMYGAGGGERILLGQQHQLCAGEIVLNAPVLRSLVPAIERLCRKYLLVKGTARLILLRRHIEKQLKVQI